MDYIRNPAPRKFDDVAEYIRRYKVEVLWADDIASSTYQITTGMNTWAIRASDVAHGVDSDKASVLRQVLKTREGKDALLRTPNAMRDAPPLPSRTVWERLLDDD
jgi:hypothetical protein